MNKTIYYVLSIILLHSLVKSQEDINELKEHIDSVCQEPDHKHYTKLTLGYITPWNINGLDLSLKYSAKFDLISPAWFEIKHENLQEKFHSKIEGSNNINTKYMLELKENKPEIKIFPDLNARASLLRIMKSLLKRKMPISLFEF